MKKSIVFLAFICSSLFGFSQSYQKELKKLNDFLQTFDDGFYGYFEVKDGYIYDRFKAGKYNKFKMEDIEGAVIQEQFSRVIFKCNNGNTCITTDWKENGKEEYTQFTNNGPYNYQELAMLLNNFRDAYLGKSTSPTTTTNENTSTPTYTKALEKLNVYLSTFDNNRYQGLEIKDGYIYCRYVNNKYAKAIIKNIDRVEINREFGYIKLACKDDATCVYSSITSENHAYFNFQTTTGNDLNGLYNLLNEFLKALKKEP